MKVSYPLSLKVSLWLVLNLLLLAALVIGFVVVQGGLGWSALVAGPTGDRAQVLFNVIAGEVSAAQGPARDAVLKRFAEAYDAEFALYAFDETRLATSGASPLPPAVQERLDFRGPGWGFFGGPPPRRRGPEGDSDSTRKRDAAEKAAREAGEGSSPRDPATPGERSRFGSEGARRGGEGGGPPPGFTPPSPDRLAGRFVVRTAAPSGYWVGLRVPATHPERGNRPIPAKMVAHVGSFWGLLNLLGVQSWLLGGGVVLIASVLFWLPLVRSITRSVSQLTVATERIAEGRFDTRVNSHRRDELGRLGDSVDRMAIRLDAHMNGQKRFLGDVAHELCSPLARLQMAAGILADQAPAAMQETVADLRDEVQQMSTLVNELLAFTKAGLQPREIVLAPTELDPLVQTALAREDAADRVVLAVPAGLRAQADADLLGRALGNLVRNALRYAGDAGPVTLSATRDGTRIVLAVEDEGPGVPATDLDRLGEPFFRPELARTREGGGVGLGLAIVRSSVAACGGEVRFSNRVPRGFRAEIRLAAA
ncbi:MAG: HAMP domain-containing sensor histidine kinase [Opitutaceae bacterium]|nr:HAMP domain-containing sensor histidine kinase [Opitutaceae bacterium]